MMFFPIPFSPVPIHALGDVSAFVIEVTAADVAASTAYHTFYVTASAGCKVYWGDGESSTLSAGTTSVTHTYARASHYLVRISGAHTRFYHGPGTTAAKVIEAVKLYSGLTSCASSFYNCSHSVFHLNPSLRLPLLVTIVDYMFFGCSGNEFTIVPGFVLHEGITSANGFCQSCSGAKFTVPAGFTNPSTLLAALRQFYYCRGAAFSLPSGFSPGSHLQNGQEMLAYCNGTGFTSLPNTFVFPATATNLKMALYYVSRVTSSMADRWPTWAAGASVDLTSVCEGMGAATGTVPSAKLWDRSDVTFTSTAAFRLCTNLTNYASIPAGWK